MSVQSKYNQGTESLKRQLGKMNKTQNLLGVSTLVYYVQLFLKYAAYVIFSAYFSSHTGFDLDLVKKLCFKTYNKLNLFEQ